MSDDELFAIDANTGSLTFVNAPDFETALDDDADNVYNIVVTATDEASNTSSMTVGITALDVDEDAPVFTSPAAASFEENGTGTVYTAVATDQGTILQLDRKY
ncbi:cadherin repeat domain-containing protein [Ekhidna sp.]